MSAPWGRRQRAAFVGIVGASVAVLSWAAVWVTLRESSLALWWPAAGVAVAGLVTADRRDRSSVIAVVFLANVAGTMVAGRPLSTSVWFGLANAAEVGLAGWLLLKGRERRPPLSALTDLWRLLSAAFAGAVVGAAGITATVAVISGGAVWPTILQVTASHASAVLLIVPLVLVQPAERVDIPRVEVVAQFAAVAVVTALIFTSQEHVAQVFLLLPVLAWGAVRLPLRWVTWETSLTLIGALTLTALDADRVRSLPALLGAENREAMPPVVEFVLTQLFVLTTVVMILGLSIVVSQRARMLADVRRSEQILRGGFEDALLGTVIVRASRGSVEVVEINPVAMDLLDATPDRDTAWQDAFGSAWPGIQAVLLDVGEGRLSHWRDEVQLSTSSGTRWAEILASDLTDERGMLVLQLSETTKRKLAELELEHQAVHDALTGLPNSTLVRDRVDLALAAMARSHGSVALLILDLDDFQLVNDTVGHAVGDEILRQTAQRLEAAVRSGDTVARLGDDEFAIVLPGVDMATASALVTRVGASFDEPFLVAAGPFRVGVSVGVAMSGQGGTFDDLLRDAGTAVHRAKAQGRGQATWFDPSFHEVAVRSSTIRSEFDGAASRGEVVLFAQPIVELATGNVVAAEALVRWQHPSRGLLGPAEWLEIVNVGPAGAELESWVLNAACSELAEWFESKGDHCPRLHVNVSTTLLRRGDLARHVLDVVRSSGAPPGLLVIELTETDLESARGSLPKELRALRAAGVRIAVDDFGTGFSSLGRIARLPLDELKIDQSFTSTMLEDSRSGVIVDAVIRLAGALDLRIVAEGIETPQQADHLRSLGCEFGQGYLWGHPQPIEQLLPREAGAASQSRRS